MAMLRVGLQLGALILSATLTVSAQNTITATQARDHVGERATVCGAVVSTHYAASTHGNPTFINLDKPYPNIE
jgi:hypothetical protein